MIVTFHDSLKKGKSYPLPIPEETIDQATQLYRDVFNAEWGEDWDLVSAKSEVQNTLDLLGNYSWRFIHASFLKEEDKVVGMTVAHTLTVKETRLTDMCFSADIESRRRGLAAVREKVPTEQLIMFFREMLVHPESRSGLGSVQMAYDVFKWAKSNRVQTGFLWTSKTKSKVYQIALKHFGWEVIHDFKDPYDCVLISGSITGAIEALKSLLEARNKD